MNYSYIPQKVKQKNPIYSKTCPKCGSDKTFNIMNCPDSPKTCYNCQHGFSPCIIGYKEVIVEKTPT